MEHINLRINEDLHLALTYGLNNLISEVQATSELKGGTPTVSIVSPLADTGLLVIPISSVQFGTESYITCVFVDNYLLTQIKSGKVIDRDDITHSCILPYRSQKGGLLDVYIEAHKAGKVPQPALCHNNITCYPVSGKIRFLDNLVALENQLYKEAAIDKADLVDVLENPYFELTLGWEGLVELVKLSKAFTELVEYLTHETDVYQ